MIGQFFILFQAPPCFVTYTSQVSGCGSGGPSDAPAAVQKSAGEDWKTKKKFESGCLRRVFPFQIQRMTNSCKLKHKYWQRPATHKHTNRKQCLHQYCREPQGSPSIGKAFICYVCECLIFNAQSPQDWHTSRKEIKHGCTCTHGLDSRLCDLNLNTGAKVEFGTDGGASSEG